MFGDDSDDDSEHSSSGHLVHAAGPGHEDPRTISQIKRSRIDLDRRYVFLCPGFLSKHFDVLPHQAKDGALLVFRCCRRWVFQDFDLRRLQSINPRVDCGFTKPGRKHSSSTKMPSPAVFRSEFSRGFLQWVETKEKESCVFWFEPGTDLEKLSKFFQEKIDPMTEQQYRPLLLDPLWWRTRFRASSAKFVMNPSSVIASISEKPHGCREKPMDIPALQELIYQSNPTLEPTARWPHAPSMRYLPRVATAQGSSVGNSPRDMERSGCRGYIDNDRLCTGLGAPRLVGGDFSRIGKWPMTPQTRFDDLHRSWHLDQAQSERRHHLQNFGQGLLRTT